MKQWVQEFHYVIQYLLNIPIFKVLMLKVAPNAELMYCPQLPKGIL
jgi:hypothetical protein